MEGTLENLQAYGNSGDFVLGTVANKKILIEHIPSIRKTYIAYINQSDDPENLWLWRVEIGGAIGNEHAIKCDFTHFILELIAREKAD